MATNIDDGVLIPVIDVSGNAPEAKIAEQLVNAATRHGFLYIKNKGIDIPVDAINSMFEIVCAWRRASMTMS